MKRQLQSGWFALFFEVVEELAGEDGLTDAARTIAERQQKGRR